MSDGMKISEAPEAPKKEEIQESPEKIAEVKEAAEQQKKVNDATEQPEKVVEEMDYKAAETLEAAVVESIQLTPAIEAATPAAKEGNEGRDPSPQVEEPTSQGSDRAGSPSGSGETHEAANQKAPSEVQTAASELSTTVPAITLEDAGEAGKVTIESAAAEQPETGESSAETSRPDGPEKPDIDPIENEFDPSQDVGEKAGGTGQPEMQEKAAEKAPETIRAAAETASVPDLERVDRNDGEPKMVITDPDADDGSFNTDDGYEQAGDIREDTRISDQYGSGVDERGESVGYQGDPAGGGAEIPEVPDMIADLGGVTPGEGGGKEVDAGLPGLDQMGEVAGLADSVAPGADGRIAGDDDTTDDTADSSDASNSSDSSDSSDGGGGKPADQGHQTNKDGSVGNVVSAPTTVRSVLGDAWNYISSDSNDDTPANATIGVRGTPTPDSVENVDFDDTLGGLIPGALPDATPDDLGDESLMQPVGEEDSASRRNPNLVFDRTNQTDPYAQYTGEETNVPGIIPAGEVDVDGTLIDGPDVVLGEEGGFISTDSSNKNMAENEDASNLNAADLDGEGQVPKP